jgi:hypothetical protein
MKPSQLASQLRRIASAIDNSKQPDRTLVARDLKKVLASVSKTAGSGSIIIQIISGNNGDDYLIMQSQTVSSTEPFDMITLPNGEQIIIAKTLADIKNNIDEGEHEGLLKALYNAGLIQYDTDSDEYTWPKN